MALAVLATTFVFNLLGRGSGEIYTVFLLPLEREMGWTRSEMTGVYSLYMLVGGFVAPLVGTLFDRFGPRVVYLIGLSCLGAANFLASTMTTLTEFFIYSGAMVGIGVALVGMVPASGLLVRWHRSRLSRAISIAFSGAGCGTLLFVPLAQALLGELDWRGTYRAIGIGLLVLAPILALALPWKRFSAGHPDLRSAQQSSGGIGGWTLRSAARTPGYWGLAIVFAFTSVGMFTVVPQLVAYLIDSGFSPLTAASTYGAIGVLSVISVVSTGFLAERIGYRKTLTGSFVVSATGVAILFIMSYHPSTWLLPLFTIVFGLAMGTRGPIVSAICARKYAGPRVATIYGTIYSMNAIGGATGALLGGVLHDLTGGYRAGFVVGVAALCIAALPMWVVRELREFR